MTSLPKAVAMHPPSGTADVTVVIATFNRAGFLPEAIDSLLGQSVAPARLLLVDDGSTDATPAVAQRYAARVDCIRKPNGGKAAALNLALRSITTRYVWFFDDDDAARPDALATLLGAMSQATDLGFAFGSFDVVRSEGRLLGAAAEPAPYRFGGESMATQRLQLYRACTIMMSGALLDSAAVRAVGGFNETLIRSQDYDLMVRLAARFDFRFCGASVYVLREHDGLRGSQRMRHPGARRAEVWARYNEPIGRFLRDELALGAFLVAPDQPAGPARWRQALLNRAWALAPKLPPAASVDDLLEAFATRCADPLSAAQRALIEEIFHHEFAAFQPVRPLFRLWRLALDPTGRGALRDIARGIYWQARKESKPFDRARLGFAALVLTGLARVGGSLQVVRTLAMARRLKA